MGQKSKTGSDAVEMPGNPGFPGISTASLPVNTFPSESLILIDTETAKSIPAL